MQIFKRVKAQNLVEFVFVLPILIFLTLVIFEVALFWQETNAIYNLNAEINANAALVEPYGMALGDTCKAAKAAADTFQTKASLVSLTNNTLTKTILDGNEPFALYKYVSGTTVTAGGVTKPQVALWVDCRNPFENGVTTQIEFYHKTMIMKASIPRFDNEPPIVIIPANIFVASSKLNTIRHY